MNRREQVAVVGVMPPTALVAHRSLFTALETAFPVRFVAGGAGVDAMIGAGESAVPAEPEASHGATARLTFAPAPAGTRRLGVARLLASPDVERALHGVELRGQQLDAPLELEPGVVPLARGRDGPVWTSRRASVVVQHVAVELPVLAEDRGLFDVLHGPHSLALIALVQFLRAVAPGGWSDQGLRAAFVLDDPNLRFPRYGHLDYRRLVEHSDEHGYHAAMAMVPLDARHWSERAVRVFRARPDRLSLVIHGNDHVRGELSANDDFHSALALGAQALRRIWWFESKTGIPVDQVMIPPHETWSRAGARALAALGYDALSASYPYPPADAPQPRHPLARWTPADFLEGCAVIPRVSLSVDRTSLALRAFLRQPLILYGHHYDVAAGLEPLAVAAGRVNGLGDVRWCSVGNVVRTNRELRVEGGTLEVRPWAQSVGVGAPLPATIGDVEPGAGAHTMTVAEPPALDGNRPTAWSAAGDGSAWRAFGELVPTTTDNLTITLRGMSSVEARSISSPPRSLSALARRRLSEVRDQLVPLTYQARSHSHRPRPGGRATSRTRHG